MGATVRLQPANRSLVQLLCGAPKSHGAHRLINITNLGPLPCDKKHLEASSMAPKNIGWDSGSGSSLWLSAAVLTNIGKFLTNLNLSFLS